MNTSQKASLEAVIEAWFDANSGDIDIYWPDHFAKKVVDNVADTIELIQSSLWHKENN